MTARCFRARFFEDKNLGLFIIIIYFLTLPTAGCRHLFLCGIQTDRVSLIYQSGFDYIVCSSRCRRYTTLLHFYNHISAIIRLSSYSTGHPRNVFCPVGLEFYNAVIDVMRLRKSTLGPRSTSHQCLLLFFRSFHQLDKMISKKFIFCQHEYEKIYRAHQNQINF